MNCNQTVICGTIIEMGGLRYTPAGVAVAELRLSHASRQIEADRLRDVECEIPAVALGQMAETIARAATGTTVKVTGFLAKKSRMSFQLVLHVNMVEFV